ncbi:MAG: hypothetical protein H0T79_08055 [Deltaproteobacteria bacterium]|nr:hypothetical protein [Deltaproteobacteria bacterium]
MRSTVAALLVVSTSACSFFMTSNPAPPPGPANCDPTRTGPALDAIGIVTTPLALGLTYALVAANGAKDWDDDTDGPALGLIVATSMITEIVAAVVGFSRTGRCAEAIEARTVNQGFYPYPRPYQQPPPQPVGPEAGMERGLCRTDGSCNPGLTCASNRCVVLPTP